jgi:alpha-mannosidase
MTVLIKAEVSDDLVLRGYEAEGKPCSAQVTLAAPLSLRAVHSADLLETDEREIPADAHGFKAEMAAYSIETFKLYGEPRW